MIRVAPSKSAILPHRTGATLVEVLMALLIMAVGVTSVFTLFPLAILKAVKANQMTNSKLYEGSIKDLLLGNSQLWTGAPQWSEQTEYGQLPFANPTPLNISSDIPSRWVSPMATRGLFPDTNLLFSYEGASSGVSLPFQPSFDTASNWLPNTYRGGYLNRSSGQPPVADGGLSWVPYRHSPYIPNLSWSAYIVDPLGWHRKDSTSIDRYQFGLVSADTTSAAYHLDRIHCQLSSNAADQFFRLQDSWNETVENTPVTVSAPAADQLEIVFPDTMDVTGQSGLNRIVLRSTSSPQAVEYSLAGATNPSNNWTLLINGDLPAGFAPDQARIEVQSPSRYSWLMAVHSGPHGEFEAQCAVVFNRTFETLDEQGYRAEFWSTANSNMAKVRWPYNADSESPHIREGGYICDASHGYWYQIQKIEENEKLIDRDTDTPDPLGTYARSILRLSDPVVVATGDPSNPSTLSDYLLNDGTNDCQAVIIPGVIHVFSFAP